MTKPVKQPVIHYVVEGNENAPVIVLISGVGGDLRHWQGLRLMLQDQYRVVSLDNRDSGHSERGDGQYYIKDMANDDWYEDPTPHIAEEASAIIDLAVDQGIIRI